MVLIRIGQRLKNIVKSEFSCQSNSRTDTDVRYQTFIVLILSDRIMVMDSGRLVEFDAPTALLRDTSSLFFSLVHGSDQEGDN